MPLFRSETSPGYSRLVISKSIKMASVVAPQFLGSQALKVIKETSKALRAMKKVDPRDRYVLLFPPSDHAYVGMGFKLLTCKSAEKVFEDASDLVGKDLLKLCLDGPRSDLLNSIENRHLATFVTSHATVTKLAEERPGLIPISKGAGGFEIGFMNCLVFSGAMSFKNAIDLIQQQGRAMDRAAQIVPNSRVKVRLMPATSKYRVCKAAIEHCVKSGIPAEIAHCSVTKQMHPHVLEIAGHEEAIKYLETEGSRLFKFRYISRVQKTPYAFNTKLMKPVSEFIREYLNLKMKEDPNFLVDPATCSVWSSIAARRLRVTKYIIRDLINFPSNQIKAEQTFTSLYTRPSNVAQPNTLVIWSRDLLKNMSMVNLRAWRQAKLYT